MCRRETIKRRLFRYALYGWGVPLLLVFVTILMQSLDERITDGYVVPGWGVTSCWFANNKALILYFYVILGRAATSLPLRFKGSFTIY